MMNTSGVITPPCAADNTILSLGDDHEISDAGAIAKSAGAGKIWQQPALIGPRPEHHQHQQALQQAFSRA